MKSNRTVVIVDYGLGNLFSLQRALNHLGHNPVTSHDPSFIKRADHLILPGVGAFGDGMSNLRNRELIEPIVEYAQSGKPLLGICLGMQLLMTESEEFGSHEGLNLIGGKVKRFPNPKPNGLQYKIPNVGWRALRIHKKEQAGRQTILDGITDDTCMYFVHSYFVIPDNDEYVLAETDCGGVSYCSVVCKQNICGCQFHPEKSGEKGLEILRNFISFSFQFSVVS